MDVRKLPGHHQHSLDLGGCEPLLSFLSTYMYFKKYIYGFGILLSPGIHGFKEMQGIDGFNQRSIRKDEFQLVGLQVTYEMLFYVRRQLQSLGCKLLRTVLAEGPLPLAISLKYGFERMEFGNCHQFDP